MANRSQSSPAFDSLPGGDLVLQGLDDLRRGVESIPSLLVRSFAPRLRRLNLDVPEYDPRDPLPEHLLYARLQENLGDGAHSRYNALIRRLVSFARAAECAG